MYYLFSPAYAQGPQNFANCRLGLAGSTNVSGYNLEQLNLGRYLHYYTKPSRPTGLPDATQYIHIIRIKQDKVGGWNSAYADPPSYTLDPDLDTVTSNAVALPGSLWFVGNGDRQA